MTLPYQWLPTPMMIDHRYDVGPVAHNGFTMMPSLLSLRLREQILRIV